MATIDFTVQRLRDNVVKVTWTPLTEADDGAPYPSAYLADKTVQTIGSLGAGGMVDWEGTNNGGANFSQLRDFRGKLIAHGAVGDLSLVAENPQTIRPNVTSGSGVSATAIAVIVLAKGGSTPGGNP